MRPWTDKIVISHDDVHYIRFNFFIQFLCLISCFYYGSIAGIRYSEFDSFSISNLSWMGYFECMFFVHMATQFLLEYQEEGKHPVRDIPMIASNYIQGEFALDIIPLIPLQLIKLNQDREQLFYIIKLLRLNKCLSLFDINRIMKQVKAYFKRSYESQVEQDPMLAYNTDIDMNKIEECLLTEYALKIIKLVIMILTISYFFGIIFLVVCEAVFDFQFKIDIDDFRMGKVDFEELPELFLSYFNIDGKKQMEILVISTYFACTSLSTVGFGDYTPRGNIERFVGAFILLFGVAIFSIVMGNLMDILADFKEFHQDIGDGEKLSQFFGTLKYFN
jgi:hypothetical protein